MGRESTGIKKHLGTLAKSMGTMKSKRAQFGEDGGAPCGYTCVNAIILSNIKQALGLDQAKGCFTAAAPISPDTLWYFASLDIPVYEVFGQSECTGPHTVSSKSQWKIGTCGRPLRGTQTRIDRTTGELCYRGRHVFMGYMHLPKETAETIDADGYLHSGDVAEFDNDNHPDVRILSQPCTIKCLLVIFGVVVCYCMHLFGNLMLSVFVISSTWTSTLSYPQTHVFTLFYLCFRCPHPQASCVSRDASRSSSSRRVARMSHLFSSRTR